jgi:hypothetical protein
MGVMSEPLVTSSGAPEVAKEKPPPFIQIVKTQGACSINHNLIDPWLALALLEMGKQAIIDSMKPQLVKPTNGIAGIMAKMGRS